MDRGRKETKMGGLVKEYGETDARNIDSEGLNLPLDTFVMIFLWQVSAFGFKPKLLHQVNGGWFEETRKK